MKKLALLAVCGVLAAPAFAQDRGYGYGRQNRDVYSDDSRQPRYGYSDSRGRRYVNIGAEVCGVTEVRIVVQRDALRINDLDVMFGDGETQDIRLRMNFSPGQTSRWVRLQNGPRCIRGLYIDAEGDNNNRNRATVTLQARIPTEYSTAINISEPIVVRDHNFSRRRRG